MGIDLGKNYFFVNTSFEDSDRLDDFIDQGIWELNLEDKEDEMQRFSEISVGDYVVAKTSVTRKTELPFENPNNNTISVMRIKAVGIVEGISGEERSITVNLLKDYRQEKKEWFFYTSEEQIWQPEISK